jgi:hypothetical protein
MNLIESLEDRINGIITYEMQDGRRVALDAYAVREYGLATILREYGLGHLVSAAERISVIQHGRPAGTLPGDFDPFNVKSTSFLYDYRPGDLKRDGNVWIACRTLGASDLDCIPGFVRASA